jgi:hypothetical protein
MKQNNEDVQLKRSLEITTQYIRNPMVFHHDTRNANRKNIKNCIKLDRDQQPTIAPFTYRLHEAEKQQESIKDEVMYCMPGWIRRKWYDNRVMSNRCGI